MPRNGANSYDEGAGRHRRAAAGDNTPIEKTLLQTPGFSQDLAASGALHLRNEHANVQYRINGVLLPDGVSGFGQVLDSGLIGNIAVIDGALPAEYGLHTSGIVDITTKSGAFDGGGGVSLYGGSRQTITPSFEYGGTVGDTQYFVTGRYFGSNEGIENPTASLNAIHDHTDQGKFFGYVSTLLGDEGRLSFISGVFGRRLPNPQQSRPAAFFTVPGVDNFDSSQINEHQFEQNYYNVAAFQQTVGNVDYQISAFSRYSSLNFMPDPIGDLVFNGVASTVSRTSFLNGVQGDAAIKLDSAHTCGSASRRAASRHDEQFLGRLSGRRRRRRRRPAVRRADRCRFEDRLAVRRLCAGRMEDHPATDPERRPALRPDGRICRRQSAQPAHQRDL